MSRKIETLDREIAISSQGYYQLPLEQRLETYVFLVHKIYDRNAEVLNKFQTGRGYTSDSKPDSSQLTAELRDIAPRFNGQVQSRFFHPSVSLHYITDSASMADLFNQSLFGRITGKVIVDGDNVLAAHHRDLSGLVIVQAKMETPERDRHVAMHEVNHAIHSQYPNAKRRDRLASKFSEDMSVIDRVSTLVGLNEAIIIDEAAASIHPYAGLEEPKAVFTADYVGEVRDATRNMIGFQLSAIRNSGEVDDFTAARITKHERDSVRVPFAIQNAIESLASRLRNPEKLDPWGYAMSYVEEALQIVDFGEISTDLERFCLQVLEPHRLYGRSTNLLEGLATPPSR